MTCEEFAMAGLDLGSASGGSPLEQAAREHLRNCAHCAALHDSWQTLRADLRLMGRETGDTEVPSRVEMRLRQEFRTKHKTMKTRRVAVIAAWAMAATAALIAMVSLVSWHLQQNPGVARNTAPTNSAAPLQNAVSVPGGGSPAGAELGDAVIASNGSGEFTLLPGSMPPVPEDATVVRVRMQRASLGALGLTVNEEHAGDWIQVDLLVGDDGQPQALRLPQTSSQATN
jgi:hypothetical protein